MKYLLVKEVVNPSVGPSPASGLTTSDFPIDVPTSEGGQNDWSCCWLLEELRTRDSHKWSGTNTHPVYHTNKLGNVINAFAHFVYMQSMSEIVLADIQSLYP